jgi:hypothetical protein
MRALVAAVLVAALAVGAWLGASTLRPPQVVSAAAPPTVFSAERALAHLRVIAQVPHPMGTPENRRVRDYLVETLRAAGLAPQVQRTSVVWSPGYHYRVADVENVLARVPGATSPGRAGAVMLVAHYDSAPGSPGASDDGAAVAALLETARALRSGTPLAGDVILLFTDGEERGLLGARAFVAEHPWAADVAVVLNFEARGGGGPSLMFETSGGAARLVDTLAGSQAGAVATSYASAVYGAMDNDTDFSVFADAGLPGLNFALLDGLVQYHTALDTIDRLDLRSLQHHGEHALALARNLAGRADARTRAGDAVYFNVPGAGLIAYGEGWGGMFALVALVATLAAIVAAVRAGRVTPIGVCRGLLATVVTPMGAGVAGLAALVGGELIVGDPALARWDELGLPVAGALCVVLAAAAALHLAFRRWVSAPEHAAGALFLGSLLAVWSAVVVPGAGYLFVLPVACGAIALTLSAARPAVWIVAGIALCATAVVAVWTPVFLLLTIALGGAAIVITAALAGFVYVALSASMERIVQPFGRRVPAALALVGLALLTVGLYGRAYGADFPQPTSLVYTLDLDTGAASWTSFDRAPDAWTRHVLSGAQPTDVSAFFPGARALSAPAAAISAIGPSATVLHDDASALVRRLRVHVTPSPDTPVVFLDLASAQPIKAVTIAGRILDRPAEATGAWSFAYLAPPPDGFDLTVELAAATPLTLAAVEMRYGLPTTADLPPRPVHLMPNPDRPSAATYLRRAYSL